LGDFRSLDHLRSPAHSQAYRGNAPRLLSLRAIAFTPQCQLERLYFSACTSYNIFPSHSKKIRWALSELLPVNLDQTENIASLRGGRSGGSLTSTIHTPTAFFTGGHLPAREILVRFHLPFPIVLALAQRIYLVSSLFGPLARKPTCCLLLVHHILCTVCTAAMGSLPKNCICKIFREIVHINIQGSRVNAFLHNA